MNTRLYVGGIPYKTTNEELAAAFGEAGEVTSATIIMDRATGRSKGFGFVEMANAEGAEAAIKMWHEQEFNDRRLTVSHARPKDSE